MEVYFDGKKLSKDQYRINGSAVQINEDLFDGYPLDENGELPKIPTKICYSNRRNLNRAERRKR